MVIASKWGNVIDPETRMLTGTDDSPGYVRRALDATLERLGTDYLDLYQLHIGPSIEDAEPLRAVCEESDHLAEIDGVLAAT